MTFEARLQLIKYLDSLIGRRFKGTSKEYADKLNVSSATFFRLLSHVKEEYGVAVRYNSTENCYEYDRAGKLYFGFISGENKKF